MEEDNSKTKIRTRRAIPRDCGERKLTEKAKMRRHPRMFEAGKACLHSRNFDHRLRRMCLAKVQAPTSIASGCRQILTYSTTVEEDSSGLAMAMDVAAYFSGFRSPAFVDGYFFAPYK